MTNLLGFTTEEWDVLESAPMLAGLLVGDLSDSRRWLTELYAVFDAAEAPSRAAESVLIRAVKARMLAHEGDVMELPVDLPANPPEARAHLIAGCLQAVRLVAERAPAEAPAFKQWLIEVARTAAASTREGGFLGFGGERISAAEESILHELETALNLMV